MLNYNISLLKTIKEPLMQSFDELIDDLDSVLSSDKAPKDLGTGPIVNIIGSMQMVGRTSLVQVAKDVRHAIEQVQKADAMNWDHIRVSEVVRAVKNAVVEMLDQTRALERGEKKLAVTLWPLWAQLQKVMKREAPPVEILFDPDPNISADQFSALDLETLSTSSQPHLARFESALQKFSQLQQQGGDIQGQWDELLKDVEPVFDWAYALRHRLGYQGYWLAARARIAYELLNSGKNSSAQNDQLVQSLKAAQVEMRKFVGDNRKPRPEAVQQMMQPLLHPWPISWDAMYGALSEVKDVFELERFWEMSTTVQSSKDDSAGRALVSDINELLGSVQALKTAWTNLSAAEEPDPRPFLRGLMTFLPRYEMFPNPGSKNLLDALKTVAHRFVSSRRNDVPQDFSQEVAVALLLIEETIARKGNWPAELEKQSDLAKRRVVLAANDAGEQLHALPVVTWGQEKSRQQSQAAVSKVIKEVLADLQFIEEVFDDFFRHDAQEARRHADEVKNKSLTSLSILNALGQHNAVVVMQEINQHISLLNRPNPQDYKKEYATLSIALTGLTTFLSAFEKGDDDALRLLETALKHIGAAKEKDKNLNEFESSLLTHTDTAEDAFASSVEPDAVEPVEVEPYAPEIEEAPPVQAENAQQEQYPVVDPIAELRDVPAQDLDEVPVAFDERSPTQEFDDLFDEEPEVASEQSFSSVPTQDEMDRAQAHAQSSFEDKRAWTDEVVDAELAEAFFEEGVMVLGEVDRLREQLRAQFSKNDLIDLRRQFHTLKGSGRTTQLWGTGEFARRIEVRLNESVSKNLEYTPALDALVDYGFNVFELAFGELLNNNQYTFTPDIIEGLLVSVADSYEVQHNDTVEETVAEESDGQDPLSMNWDALIGNDAPQQDHESARPSDHIEHNGIEVSEPAQNEDGVDHAAVRQEELARLEQVHAEENTQAQEVDGDVVQVEIPRLRQTEHDVLIQDAARNEEEPLETEPESDLFADEDEQFAQEVEEAEDDFGSRAEDVEQVVPASNVLDEEQMDAILVDLETHSNNLIDILGQDELDIASLHWSAHTIAALAMNLEQRRFHVFAKKVERAVDGAIDQETGAVMSLSDSNQLLLRNAAEVLLDKAAQSLSEPTQHLLWNEWEEQIEEEIDSFNPTDSAAEDDASDHGVGVQFDQDHSHVEDEVEDASSESDADENDMPSRIDEDLEAASEVEENTAANTADITDAVDFEVARTLETASELNQQELIDEIANKMGAIAQQMAELHALWERLSSGKNKE